MYCHNCGKKIPDGTNFCHYCGAAQNRVRSAPAAPAAPAAQGAPSNNRSRQNPSSGGSSMFSKIMSIAVAAAIAYFCFFSDTDDDARTTSGSPSQTNYSISPFADIEAPSSVPLPQPTVSVPVVDKRIPDYRQTNPQWEVFRYEWYCLNGYDIMWLEVPVDVQMYTYYRNLERYMGVGNYYNYVDDTNNREIIRQIVSAIQDVGDSLSYTDMDMIREVVKFVQDVIEYEYDIDSTGEIEYPRYPIETLCERRGDCEDTAILMAAMLRELGYDVGFLHLPKHLAVAVRAVDDYDSSSYYEINGHRYVYIESTGSGWNIGDIPEDFRQTEAEFFQLP